jgi:protein-tyrosine phosphatase
MTDPDLPEPRHPGEPYRVCCVCLGNICRSPMAEVVLRDQVAKAALAGQIVVDSAGTGDWHVGGPMEREARAQLAKRGYDGEAHRARQFDRDWLPGRDLVLAMDASNYRDLRAMAPREEADRIVLFGDVAGFGGRDVPDPYYGEAEDFAAVLTMLEEGMARLVERLQGLRATTA